MSSVYKSLPDGIWPVMLTPFHEDGSIDYPALEQLIEWYLEKGAHGLFAVCLSSEMLALTLEERVQVAAFVQEKAAGRVPVVASGHMAENLEDQIEELKAIAATGVDAVVLVTNRLAKKDEDDEVWKSNLLRVMDALPGVPLGLYECPVPYHRLLTPELLKFCAETGRFVFMKETSCSLVDMEKKIAAAAGTPLKLFNANGTTFLASLQQGMNGYSGILTNFHPDLYVWLAENWQKEPDKAEALQHLLGPLHLFEGRLYPTNAKYLLQQEGLGLTLHSRVRDCRDFRPVNQLETEQFLAISRFIRHTLHIGRE